MFSFLLTASLEGEEGVGGAYQGYHSDVSEPRNPHLIDESLCRRVCVCVRVCNEAEHRVACEV